MKGNFYGKVMRYAAKKGVEYVKKNPMKSVKMAGKALHYLTSGKEQAAQFRSGQSVKRKAGKWLSEVKAKTKRRRYRRRIYHEGRYVGKFKKVSRTPFNTMLKYNKYGIAERSETSGTITDDDCAYVINSCVEPQGFIDLVILALMRKLFEKAGITIQSVRDAIGIVGGFSTASSLATGTWIVELIRRNLNDQPPIAGSIIGPVTWTLTGTSVLADACAIFRNNLISLTAGFDNASGVGTSGNLTCEHEFSLIRVYATGEYDIKSTLKLSECRIHAKMSSLLKVQNRTLAAGELDDNSDETDNVSARPLEGYVYKFKGVPHPKDMNVGIGGITDVNAAAYFGTLPKGGVCVKAFGGATMVAAGVSGDFREPPSKGIFTNCVGAARARLNPGEIKEMKLYDKLNGGFYAVMKKIRLQFGTAGAGTNDYGIAYMPFNCQMISLEPVIRIASEGSGCTLAYEVDRTVGIIINETKQKHLRTIVDLNNV